MKHIFFVHSNITKITALKTIEYLHLKADDIYISCPSSFKGDFASFKNVYHFRYELSLRTKPHNNLFGLRTKSYSEFDNFLSRALQDETFAIYIPHIHSSDYQIIASHKNCKEVNFLEEGMSSYFPITEFHGTLLAEKRHIWKFKLKNFLYLWNLRRTFTPKNFFDIDYLKKTDIHFFGITEKSFPFVSQTRKTVLNDPYNKEYSGESANFYILILEALPENKLINEEFYIKKVIQILESSREKGVVKIKYHPNQSKNVKDAINRYLNTENIPYEIMDDHFVMEDLFITSPEKLYVLGFISSLLLYAKYAGHHVKSFESVLMDDQIYSEHIKKNNLDFQSLISE